MKLLALALAMLSLAAFAASAARSDAAQPAPAIDIGSRRELFVDDFLVERLSGKAELRLHHPQPQEIAIVFDAPWEGPGSGSNNVSVFQDGDKYRMYYQAVNFDPYKQRHEKEEDAWFAHCYAESNDGIHWRKPELGLFEFQGSKANNIVFPKGKFHGHTINASSIAIFKDDNPAAPADARYKAIVRSQEPSGLIPFKSPDGIHWSPMAPAPVITDGWFDSQNLAFWDAVRGEYRIYWRFYTNRKPGEPKNPNLPILRAIRTATSRDFVHWTGQVDVKYVDSPPEHIYTNQIKPYHRAPHLFVGIPTRYIDRGWSDSMRALPDAEHRAWRGKANERFGTAITEALFMASRDGSTFKRWNEAFLRPGIERTGTWDYGNQYVAWQIVETKSALEGAPNELSFYASESSMTGRSAAGKGPAERRYTLRLDGFVSVNAPLSGGEILTKPLRFQGNRLELNFSSSAAGSVRVELQDESGQPIPGFALEDCPPIFGDAIERTVTWKTGSDVTAMAGKPVRLRFALKDADLFAFKFSGR